MIIMNYTRFNTKIIILILGIIAFLSCSKEAITPENSPIMNCSKGDTTIVSANNTYFTLTTQDWYLARFSSGGGSTHVFVSGSTNADSATIRTYGDGLITDMEININADSKFHEDVGINFNATSVPEGEITVSTFVFAYKDNDTLKINLESCILRY